MLDANTIDAIANEIIRQMQKGSAPAGQRAPQGDAAVPAPLPAALQSGEKDAGEMEDITSAAQKAVPTLWRRWCWRPAWSIPSPLSVRRWWGRRPGWSACRFMGCDCCYTNHMLAEQNDIENLAMLLGAAGANYILGVPTSDDGWKTRA